MTNSTPTPIGDESPAVDHFADVGKMIYEHMRLVTEYVRCSASYFDSAAITARAAVESSARHLAALSASPVVPKNDSVHLTESLRQETPDGTFDSGCAKC